METIKRLEGILNLKRRQAPNWKVSRHAASFSQIFQENMAETSKKI